MVEAFEKLDPELTFLQVRQATVQLALPRRKWSSTHPARLHLLHPGVILSFSSRSGAVALPCDQFTNWEDNLCALALMLARLRLAAGEPVSSPPHPTTPQPEIKTPALPAQFHTCEEAAAFVAQYSDLPLHRIHEEPDSFQRAYRLAARHLHPDAGGRHEEFIRLQWAAALLREKHGC